MVKKRELGRGYSSGDRNKQKQGRRRKGGEKMEKRWAEREDK